MADDQAPGISDPLLVPGENKSSPFSGGSSQSRENLKLSEGHCNRGRRPVSPKKDLGTSLPTIPRALNPIPGPALELSLRTGLGLKVALR